MQQTEKYKLNLIEPSDPFLPDSLNQNTQKIEDAMAAHETKVSGQIFTLDAKAVKTAFGELPKAGINETLTVSLSFTPYAVLVLFSPTGVNCYADMQVAGNLSGRSRIGIQEKGFSVRMDGSCVYLAFG